VKRIKLDLGTEILTRLLPHRRPMLMVDRVVSWTDTPRPTVEAYRNVSGNDPVFEGHFPGFAVWPGCLTSEGMGQTAAIMLIFTRLLRVDEIEMTPAQVFDALRNMEAAYRLSPGHRADDPDTERLQVVLEHVPPWAGFAAHVDVKFTGLVRPGDRIDYTASLERELGDYVVSEVSAHVGRESVASGKITASVKDIALPFQK